MKPVVAIALIVTGLVLFAIPPIADWLWRADSVRLLQQPGIHNVMLEGRMETGYKFGCMLAGFLCLGFAIRYSIGQFGTAGPTKPFDVKE
jgi:hypothetical protein